MKKLYFVRHGQSEMNVSGHFAGITDTHLTSLGREQAKKTGKLMKKRKLHIDTIVSSPLSRALDTAWIIAKEIGYPPHQIHTSKLLMEQDFGSLEGKPWSPDLNLDGFSDIETVDSMIERAKLAVEWLKTFDGHDILVVSHGAFGRALRSLINKDYPYDHPLHFANAELHQWL